MSYYDSYMIKVIAVWLSCLLLQQIQYSHGHRHNVPQCHNHRSVTPGVLPAFMFSCRRLLGGGVKNRRNSRKIAARRLNDRQSDSMRQIRSIRAATTTTLLLLRVCQLIDLCRTSTHSWKNAPVILTHSALKKAAAPGTSSIYYVSRLR